MLISIWKSCYRRFLSYYTHTNPWAVSNSISQALIISQSNTLFRLISYSFLYIVLCILKNKTSWIKSPLQQSECLKKERRNNKRKTSHHSQNTSGPVAPLRWEDLVVAVELSTRQVLTRVEQGLPSSRVVKEPHPHPSHHPTLKDMWKTIRM